MSNLIERHEKERQMEADIRIQQLRIKRLEHQMAYELDPFGSEFDEAAEKLRKLKAALYSAGVKKSNYHYETARLEHEVAQRKLDARGNQPEI